MTNLIGGLGIFLGIFWSLTKGVWSVLLEAIFELDETFWMNFMRLTGEIDLITSLEMILDCMGRGTIFREEIRPEFGNELFECFGLSPKLIISFVITFPM